LEEARALEGIGRCRIRIRDTEGGAHLLAALAIYRRIGAPEARQLEATLAELQGPKPCDRGGPR
jgi:hypothetical protein